jgi:YD repeat-containing protein
MNPDVTLAIQYNYVDSGQLKSVVNDDGSIILYNYDYNGNLTSKKLIKTPVVQAPSEATILYLDGVQWSG